MPKPLKVLLVEDSPEDSLLILREIAGGGYQPEHLRVETEAQMRRALEEDWDVVISDYHLPGFDAPAALQVLGQSGRSIPFIIVSGKIGEDLAVAAMKQGASDYLMKGNLARLVPVVERELRETAERRQHQQSQTLVRRAKAEWEAAFDAVSDLILVTGPEGAIVRCNARVTGYFDCGYPDLLGRRVNDVFFGDEVVEGQEFRFVHGVERELEDDIRFPKLQGWFNVASYPMRLEGHDRAATVFIIKDITKRKKVEEEKRASDRELLTLYAVAFRLQATQGMAKVMGDLLFQLHNMLQMDFSCIHLLERGSLQLKGSLGISPAFSKAMESVSKKTEWALLAATGRPFHGCEPDHRLPARAKGAAQAMGLRCWCCIPLRIGGEMIGTMMVGTREDRGYTDRDIFLLSSIAGQLAVLIENYRLYDRMKEKADELYRSKEELKANLQQVQRANLELGRLNTVKNNFIGIASHELKTPITSIMGGVEFLLKYADIPMAPEQRSIFESVYEGIVQLRRLVEDLLSISRIESHGPPQKKPVNLLRLCREVHDMFALPLSERRIAVSIDEGEIRVPVDEGFALLAVKNLMENAIKFTPDGGEVHLTGRVLKRAELKALGGTLRQFYPDFPQGLAPAKQFYLLEVRDTGIGIPPEERVRIFDKFYGVGDLGHHSSGDTAFMSKGSGLGLSIVRGIMDVHQGAVWVAGDEGSSFALLFPME